MKIYLMRHGEAAFNTRNDDERELTESGRAKIRSNILNKKSELVTVQLLLSSPIRRAVQTAHLTRDILARSDHIQEVDWLIHESRPDMAIDHLGKIQVDSVMLFSHQPLASRFAELLCGRESGTIPMNTASIIAMNVDPVARGFGEILWHLP